MSIEQMMSFVISEKKVELLVMNLALLFQIEGDNQNHEDA